MVFSTLCVCCALATAGCKFTQITLKNRLHASLQEEEVQIQKHWWLNFCYSFRAKKVSFLKFSPFLEKQLPLHILLAHLEQLQHHDFFPRKKFEPILFFRKEAYGQFSCPNHFVKRIKHHHNNNWNCFSPFSKDSIVWYENGSLKKSRVPKGKELLLLKK